MKKCYSTFIISFLLCSFSIAQTIWDGPQIVFSKAAFGDPTMEQNQDRITDNVWITRANTQGLFNAKSETSYNPDAPAGTEWAEGTTDDIGSLTFQTWVEAMNSNPPSNLNKDFVLHLLAEDIYIDIKFLSWGQGSASGGSFSYTRSTENVTGIHENDIVHQMLLSPNPCTDHLQITSSLSNENIKIFNLTNGALIKELNHRNGNTVSTSNWPAGMYVIITESGIVSKFVKI